MSMPEQKERWPSQDFEDRSEHFAIIAILDWDVGDNSIEAIQDYAGWPFLVRDQLQEAVNASVREVLQTPGIHYEAQHYQVGPAAGGIIGIEHYIVTLWENREVALQSASALANAWAIYEITRRVKTKLNSWIDAKSKPNDAVEVGIGLSFPPLVLEQLCLHHVRSAYHPRAKLDSEWQVLTQEFFGGYVLPGHPSGGLEYAVTVSTRDRTYLYRVDGTGKVTAHNVRKGKQVTTLPVPDLFEPTVTGPAVPSLAEQSQT